MVSSLKVGMTYIAVTVCNNPSLKRVDVVAHGFKGYIDDMSEGM